MSRQRLPDRRAAVSVDLEHGGSRVTVTIGFYPDGRPGEVFACSGSRALLSAASSSSRPRACSTCCRQVSSLRLFEEGSLPKLARLVAHGCPLPRQLLGVNRTKRELRENNAVDPQRTCYWGYGRFTGWSNAGHLDYDLAILRPCEVRRLWRFRIEGPCGVALNLLSSHFSPDPK